MDSVAGVNGLTPAATVPHNIDKGHWNHILGRDQQAADFAKGQRLRTRVPAIVVVLSLTLVSLLTGDDSAGSPSLEHQVKIAFLYNFAKFIDWPAGAFPDPATPMNLGLLGNDPFCREAEAALQGKIVNGRRLVARRVRSGDPLTGIDVLFVSPAQSDVRAILAKLRGAPVLTVGDAEDFARLGGIINFRMEENKVRFEINPAAAERAGLKISSRLLSIARLVQEASSQKGHR